MYVMDDSTRCEITKTDLSVKAAWWTAKFTLTLTSINYKSQWHNIAARGLLFSIEAGAVAAS